VDSHTSTLAVSPGFSRDHTLFAGTDSGIFRSHTGGRSWRELSFPMDAAPVLSLAVSPAFETDGRVYAGTEDSGLWLSDDWGGNWRQINSDLILSPVNAIHLNARAEVRLLLEDKLLWSDDGGKSWRLHSRFASYGKAAMALALDNSLPGVMTVGFADGEILRLR
jgi:photosystem II stability/assembly factor-like uncharacterized protein